jgi:hypothetical protein
MRSDAFGWPVSEDDGLSHDWAAITAAEEVIVAELRAAGWSDRRAIYQEAARRVKLGDYVVQASKAQQLQVAR